MPYGEKPLPKQTDEQAEYEKGKVKPSGDEIGKYNPNTGNPNNPNDLIIYAQLVSLKLMRNGVPPWGLRPNGIDEVIRWSNLLDSWVSDKYVKEITSAMSSGSIEWKLSPKSATYKDAMTQLWTKSNWLHDIVDSIVVAGVKKREDDIDRNVKEDIEKLKDKAGDLVLDTGLIVAAIIAAAIFLKLR
jgi:hypothetical protein